MKKAATDGGKGTPKATVCQTDTRFTSAKLAVDFDLWMACHAQGQIAEAVGCSRQTVDAILPGMADLPKLAKSSQAAAEHAVDFDLWMACHTQEQIAEAVGCDIGVVKMIWSKSAGLPELTKSSQAAAEHAAT